jgi:hypothetical protein
MSTFKGEIKSVKTTSDIEFQISMKGKFEMGNVGMLDDDDEAISKKERGVTKFEFNGFDLYNLDGGISFITVKTNLKASKGDSSIPDARLKINVKCGDHDDFMDAVKQIIDCQGKDCEIIIEWAE